MAEIPTGVDFAGKAQTQITLDKAFIQFAGITAGRATSFCPVSFSVPISKPRAMRRAGRASLKFSKPSPPWPTPGSTRSIARPP